VKRDNFCGVQVRVLETNKNKNNRNPKADEETIWARTLVPCNALHHAKETIIGERKEKERYQSSTLYEKICAIK
jgi:hypothetical protein